MAAWLVIVPLCFAALAFAAPSERYRPWLLPAAGAIQLGLVSLELLGLGAGLGRPWLGLDPLGRLIAAYLAVLFFLCAAYAPGYLALRSERPNRVFCAVMLVFFAMMNLIAGVQHLGLLWVAVEATTLATGPLLYFNRNPRSIEATWKYLLIGSVGIALALLGTFFVAYSALAGGGPVSLLLPDMLANAERLSGPWLHVGVRAGCWSAMAPRWGSRRCTLGSPMPTARRPGWSARCSPADSRAAHSLAILRFFQICAAAGEAEFARSLLLFLGLVSMAVAGAFMVRQGDYKRMLAYSSVEHMGILVLGIGDRRRRRRSARCCTCSTTGSRRGCCSSPPGTSTARIGSKRIAEVSGAVHLLPASGSLLLAGFFAITGTPPFGTFVSEFTILRGDRARRPLLDRGGVPRSSLVGVRRHGSDGAVGRAGGSAGPRAARRSIATAGSAWRRSSSCWRSCLRSGSGSRRRSSSSLREAAASLEAPK